MKNKLTCILVMIFMFISTLCIPVFAENTDFITSTDFEDYSSKWDGTTIETVLPDLPNVTGEFCSPKKLDAYSGITSGTAKDNKYSNSMKMVQRYDSSAKTYTYLGFDKEFADSLYMEVSMNVETSATGQYTARSIRINTDTIVTYPVSFSANKTIAVFGNATDGTWIPDKWYDIKIWYNINTGAYKVQISADGTTFLDTFGSTTAATKATRFLFYLNTYRNHTALNTAGEQVTYFDNFKLQQIYGFENTQSADIATFNFNAYTNTTDIKTAPGDGQWGTWNWGASKSKTHGVFAEKTDRGTSVAITSPVYTGATDASGAPTDTALENGTLTVSQLKYPRLWYVLKKDYYISDAVSFKTSVRLDDKNFGSSTVLLNTLPIFSVSPNNSNEYSHGDIYIFTNGTNTAIDTGLNLKLGCWYDIDATMDIATGYIILKISDGEEEYQYKGYVPESCYTPGTEITYFDFKHWDRNPKHDWSKSTKLLVDDIKFGNFGEMYIPGNKIYEFVLDKRTSTTGFDKTINMSDKVIACFSNEIDQSTFNANTIQINSKAIDANDIVFVDERTIQLTFDKTQNTKYKVDFKGVADIHGNTLTDYITFSTEAQDMYLSEVRYTRDGEELLKTTPGTVKVAFDGADYTKNGTEIYFTAGVYHDGRLVGAANDIFTLTETKTEYSVNVAIPDDNKHYVIKTFMWNAETAVPLTEVSMLTATIKNMPVAIPKLGAMRDTNEGISLFEDVVAFLEENEIKAVVGATLRNIDTLNVEEFENFKTRIQAIANSEMVCISACVYNSIDCSTATYEEQYADMKKSLEQWAKLDLYPPQWLPIYNACNEYTADVLNQFPQIKVTVMRRTYTEMKDRGMLDEDNNFTALYEWIPVETTVLDVNSGTHEAAPMHIDDTIAEWNMATFNRMPYVDLQWHPEYHVGKTFTNAEGETWGGEGNTMFDQILALKAQGATFMTALEYVNYLKNF